jgi:type I restriction enzyme M protein
MLNSALKSQIDTLWDKFWSGGMANPITAIEQISYLLFMRRLEETPNSAEYFAGENASCRWSVFMEIKDDTELFNHVRDTVFPFIQNLNNEVFSRHMKNAVFEITKPTLLRAAIKSIDAIYTLTQNQNQQFQDIGDIYEYLLNEIARSGKNGQFRTPRHIIQMVCALIDPDVADIEKGKIGDPACGTSGFLLGAYLHILSKNSSDDKKITNEDGFALSTIGDKLTTEQRKKLETTAFKGYDFDTTMVRFGLMNLLLHGVSTPDIQYQDTLSKQYEYETENGSYSIVLANPPFKGSIDKHDLNPDLLKSTITGKVKKTRKKADELPLTDEDGTPIPQKIEKEKEPEPYTNKTELLFLLRIIKMLKKGGRAGVIVPEGVLFGATDAHKEIRKRLTYQCSMDAVISLPSGVFKPYAGVATAVLIFTKKHDDVPAKPATKNVWFFGVENDGYEFNDKRTKRWIDKSNNQPDYGDLQTIVSIFKNKTNLDNKNRKGQYFEVPIKEVEAALFNLSMAQYKKLDYIELQFESPQSILATLAEHENAIAGYLKTINDLINA